MAFVLSLLLPSKMSQDIKMHREYAAHCEYMCQGERQNRGKHLTENCALYEFYFDRPYLYMKILTEPESLYLCLTGFKML